MLFHHYVADLLMYLHIQFKDFQYWLAQLAGAVEYTDCISAEGKDSPNKCPVYDTKPVDGEAPVLLELWEMQSTYSLPSLPGSLWLRVVASDRILAMGQIELNCVLMLKWIVWNRNVLTFKCV